MPEVPVPILSQPGIQRDGTVFSSTSYNDGQWCRFIDGDPVKMHGYRAVNKYLAGLVRTLHNHHQDNTNYIHGASANLLERLTMDNTLASSVISNRTPASLVLDSRNLWQLDTIPMAAVGLQIVAQVAPNLLCTCNSENGQLFHGDALGTAPLVEITNFPTEYNVTGGIMSLTPFLVAFGTDGFVMWSVPGDPTDFTGTGAGNAFVTSQKIIRGMPLRGGPGATPSGLLWSADTLLRMSYTGGSEVFTFDTISAQISVMSSSAFVELDGIYYWASTSRFLMFNGVVREVPNAFNREFFFDNVNYSVRQKVFAFAVPRYGEVWWCFPKGDSTEANWAVIFNTRTGEWYDTPLPNTGRGAGISPGAVFRWPMMSGIDPGPTSTPAYRLWVHEIGLDEVDGLNVNPIRSFFETAPVSLATAEQPSNNATQVLYIEPDFVQSGDMTVQVFGRRNTRAPDVVGPVMSFPDTATSVEEEVVFLKEQRRQLRFRFESNVPGGNYRAGKTLAQVKPGDGTLL